MPVLSRRLAGYRTNLDIEQISTIDVTAEGTCIVVTKSKEFKATPLFEHDQIFLTVKVNHEGSKNMFP